MREIDAIAGFEQCIGLLFGENFVRTEQEEDGWSNACEFELIEASVNDPAAIINMVALDENGEPITVEAQVLADAIAQLVFTATGFPLDEPILAVRICRMGPHLRTNARGRHRRGRQPRRLRELHRRVGAADHHGRADQHDARNSSRERRRHRQRRLT